MESNSSDGFAAVVAVMNDVAAGSGEWTDVVDPMQRLLGVDASSIEIFDKRTGQLHFLAADPLSDADQLLYEEHVHKINPRYSLIPLSNAGRIVSDRLLDPRLEAAAGEYYDWLIGATGTRYFCGATLFDTVDFLGVSSLHVRADRGPIDTAVEEMFARLRPHLANALSIHQTLVRHCRLEAIDEGALGSGRAYALIDREGRILECSEEFERSLVRSEGIAIRERRLVTDRSKDGAGLAALIAGATGERADADLTPVRIAQPDRRHGLLLRAVRLARSREMFARLRPVAMLVLIDLDMPAACAVAELRAGWGLTAREAELAMLIGEGRKIDQAATQLGITEQTARHHLKAIFRRMDIDRQSDLVRLVTRLGG